VARHRSPQGRRAHLGPPLSLSLATAGVGGAHRSTQVPQLTRSLPIRLVATVVAGGAIAATGQHVLANALPAAVDGANALGLGVSGLIDPGVEVQVAADSAPLVSDPPPALFGAVDPAPVIADAASLVKTADLQLAAAEAAEKAKAAQANAEKAKAAQAKAAQVKAAEAARSTEAAKIAPVASVVGSVQMVVGRLSSGFGLRGGAMHEGLDIAAPIGTAIRAPLAGTVISSGPASGFGLWVRVQHADGTITVYGHINRSLVRVGQKVAAGQQIAQVGNRGESTGPHLHIEVVTPGGKKINPRPWLDQHGIRY
jgi:murein DD-endopeptidase MepM/ murein hydrolase activator NlpD